MHRPAVDIYEGPLLDTTAYCLERLKHVFRTQGKTYIYAANGHGAWDAALCNTLKRGDKILVLESGRFALGWGEAAEVAGLQAEILPGSWDRSVEPARLEERLRQDINNEISAILVVQVDTASGVWNDIAALRKAIDAAGHPALFMPDGGSARADFPGGDAAVLYDSIQKVLALPDDLRLFMAEAPIDPPVLEPLTGLEIGPLPAREDLGLADDPCPDRQTGGRDAAFSTLESFLFKRGKPYRAAMATPVRAFDACSRLSPHLAFGTLSMATATRMSKTTE